MAHPAGAVSARAALASKLARKAGQLALEFFNDRDRLTVETKASALDLVSAADRAVEDLIRAGIRAEFADDAILGEERGATAGSSGLTWIIDPIDGTVPFLSGLPHWCVVIAVTEGAQKRVGVIDLPVTGEHFLARSGEGVTVNGAPVSMDASKRIDEVVIAVGASDRCERADIIKIIDGILQKGGMFYRNGSGANMLASVAAGRLGGYVEPVMNSWDSVAGLLMIEEAGGIVHPYPADQLIGPVLAAAPGVWDDLEPIVSPILKLHR